MQDREKKIYRVIVWGSVVNTLLMVAKFIAGFLGGSAAMVADAVHSLSDFLTDIVVLLFVRISSRPKDADHYYGHGKYETMATAIIGGALFAVGAMILYSSVSKIIDFAQGIPLSSPDLIAFYAAVLSIIMKEWTYRFTAKVGKEVGSQSVIANAWHHRSDAMSSIGTAIGIGGAIFLGEKWAVLDPIAAAIVSLFIFRVAYLLIKDAVGDLMEKSLPKDIEGEILKIVESNTLVSGVHNLGTRKIGNRYAIEMHIRMPGNTTLNESHAHASAIERAIKEKFGADTHVILHVEPIKVDGKYEMA